MKNYNNGIEGYGGVAANGRRDEMDELASGEGGKWKIRTTEKRRGKERNSNGDCRWENGAANSLKKFLDGRDKRSIEGGGSER